jgi:hypothetical protein
MFANRRRVRCISFDCKTLQKKTNGRHQAPLEKFLYHRGKLLYGASSKRNRLRSMQIFVERTATAISWFTAMSAFEKAETEDIWAFTFTSKRFLVLLACFTSPVEPAGCVSGVESSHSMLRFSREQDTEFGVG